MAVKSKKISEKISEATEQAKENPYLQKIVEDKELRENAVAALQSVKSAFDKAQATGLDKPADLVNDKKLRKELKNAAGALKQTKEEIAAAGAKPKKKKHRLGKLITVAVVGAAVALVVSDDLRKQVLDALFGAEEEFEYTSTTSATSTNGAS